MRRWKPRPTRANIGRAINHTLRPEDQLRSRIAVNEIANYHFSYFLTKQIIPSFRILAGSLRESDSEEEKVEKVEEEVRSRDCDRHTSLRIRLIIRSWILNLGSNGSKCL